MKQKIYTSFILSLIVATAPLVSFAVTLKHTLGTVSGIVNAVIPIVLALAVLGFFWGLMTYLFDSGNAENKKNAISMMVMGIMVIFVMVSLWGIVRVLQQTFKVDKGKPIIPDVIERRAKSNGIF